MLGIALGSFTTGLMQGIQMRGVLDYTSQQRRLKSDLKGLTATAKKDFDAKVASGQADAGDFDSYYANEVVPKYAERLLQEGEPDKAQAWTDWATSSTAKKASKQFAKGLQEFYNGDIQSGIDTMLKTANTQGYGPDGKYTAAEIYDEDAGEVTGYQLTLTQPDGKKHIKNVAAADIPNFFAAVANPQAAFETQIAGQQAQAKADLEVDTYGRKKQLDKQLGTATGALTPAQYQNAIQEERKALENSIDPEVADLSSTEKEAMAKANVDARFAGMGQTAAAGPQVAVDPQTGEQVTLGDETPTTDAAAAPEQAPTDEELGAADQPSIDGMPAPDATQANADTAPGITAPTPAAATTSIDPSQKQAAMDAAAQLMRQGGNPQQIASALAAAGVPQAQWPQDVQLAVRNAQLGVSR